MILRIAYGRLKRGGGAKYRNYGYTKQFFNPKKEAKLTSIIDPIFNVQNPNYGRGEGAASVCSNLNSSSEE